jgi:hypothetical protein
MASAKQIAWRKKFARMSKAGKFKKSSKQKMGDAQITPIGEHYERGVRKKWTQEEMTAEIVKDARQHMQWKDAKRKYGKTIELLQFYFNVPYNMRKQLGLPKTAPKF